MMCNLTPLFRLQIDISLLVISGPLSIAQRVVNKTQRPTFIRSTGNCHRHSRLDQLLPPSGAYLHAEFHADPIGPLAVHNQLLGLHNGMQKQIPMAKPLPRLIPDPYLRVNDSSPATRQQKTGTHANQMAPEDRYEKSLRVAIDVFAEPGIDGARQWDAARAAHVALPTVHACLRDPFRSQHVAFGKGTGQRAGPDTDRGSPDLLKNLRGESVEQQEHFVQSVMRTLQIWI